ncbi:nucleotide pyrophosphatase [Salipiger aestuarii]|uniref:Putative AlkP superfamily pyrophosphatase or phosphodiesterase n=1 Tax=Salipiger aestuarii TaxID=568098 RepID=A0A327YKL8_9RHOB|nr:alkaline phosphatase family protein [Salipiger aestuarii]EIE50389.1 type I phosphodiesterase/nucleotide pyrophosphatase [Citreicella sp. 357]KAA8609336.1 nucleotide pyrophosphatase [Salipiger aestuarii]KAA8615127.1 nucleotide pyrophosphatase [Salipiger aestuarii]KAB2542948.1 nucleotide pyrophosphatase [Salipiger aestuarii]RAK20877.1 putative AlkP superfamily pyrophosphatase or phosphodiesterase [Salipiger aestuarii]
MSLPRIDKVVIVLFDGLRPDMVDGAMPTLAGFRDGGLWFRNARSVFPSLTRVCTTSLATGSWPGRHGIVSNGFHLPNVLQGAQIDTSDVGHLKLMRKKLGHVVAVDSLGQALARKGKRMATVHGGSAGSAFLVNHDVVANGHWTVSVHGEEATQTPDAIARAVRACGPLPGADIPKVDAVAYAGRVLRALALAGDAAADVSVVWLPEPDTSFHYREIGSQGSRVAMAAADAAFADILDHVRGGPFAETTAIVALSDHGQISTVEEVDLMAKLNAAGFAAATRPTDTTTLAMTNGAAGELRNLTADPGLLPAVVDWLLDQPSVGAVIARDALPGTVPMDLLHHTHAHRPDLFYVMRADEGADPYGLPGRRAFTGGVPLGGGMHGGLNRQEMSTVMIWDVPGGRRGVEEAPTALVDVAPTLAAMLGLDLECQGRDLPLWQQEKHDVEHLATQGRGGAGSFTLYRTRVGPRIYIDHLV